VNKNVRARGYFAKRKVVREQRILGNTALGKRITVYQYNIGEFNKIAPQLLSRGYETYLDFQFSSSVITSLVREATDTFLVYTDGKLWMYEIKFDPSLKWIRKENRA